MIRRPRMFSVIRPAPFLGGDLKLGQAGDDFSSPGAPTTGPAGWGKMVDKVRESRVNRKDPKTFRSFLEFLGIALDSPPGWCILKWLP